MTLGTEISAHGVTLVEIMRKQISGFEVLTVTGIDANGDVETAQKISGFEVLTVTGIDANGDEIKLKLFGDGPIPIRIESEKSK